jgi:hypothetical protein
MLMTDVPIERAFLSMVHLNQLKDCPVTHDDIKIAHAIFGPNLANIRGKSVRWSPARVETDYLEIPWDLLSFHKNVTPVRDVIFVNSLPILVLVLCQINLITIKHLPKHPSASKLCYLLQRIINVYARMVFCIQTILMDNEFEKVQDHVSTANMNTPAASEYIAEIEWQICVIKEHARGILCTLPYKSSPPHAHTTSSLHHDVAQQLSFGHQNLHSIQPQRTHPLLLP